MINRRNFLKYSGLAAIALGTGYKAGKVLNSNNNHKLFLFAFLPEDVELINELIFAFKTKISTDFVVFIDADKEVKNYLPIINSVFNKNAILSNNIVKVKLNRINAKVRSDLLIGNSENYIINPAFEVDKNFSGIKNKLRGRDASLFITLEYETNNFLPSLIGGNNKEVIIENEKGIIDRIETDRTYRNIEINCLFGKTVLELENGLVRVKKSSCKHKLCEKRGFIAKPGEIIACAPNKTIIRIENV